MPIIMTFKNGSSNKTQTLALNGVSKPAQEVKDTKGSTPFIDRLYVTAKPPTTQMAKDVMGAYMEALQAFHEDFAYAKPSSGFHRAHRLALPSLIDLKKRPLLELRIVDKTVTNIRIDFIPVDLGAQGMDELHRILQSLVEDGWGFFVQYGKITRLDVAVDFPHLHMKDLYFLPRLGVTVKQWARNGSLETYQLGKAKGSHTQIYSRLAKRTAQNKSTKGKTGIRVERRLKNQSIGFQELKTLPCVFVGMNLIKRDLAPPSKFPEDLWTMFVLAAKNAGLSNALSHLPTHRRTVLRGHLKDQLVSAWDIDAIWRSWPKMLQDLKIADLQKWLG